MVIYVLHFVSLFELTSKDWFDIFARYNICCLTDIYRNFFIFCLLNSLGMVTLFFHFCIGNRNIHWRKTCNYSPCSFTTSSNVSFIWITHINTVSFNQWWSVTKYNYFVTVLKYIFQVSVLYWSSFILRNFYFYFTTIQSIRSYFLLHYIS